MNPNVYPLTIYYESACALCNAEMTNLQLRNTRKLLAFVDISAPGFSGLPEGTTLAAMLEEIHGQQADGTVLRGVDVFRAAYAAAGMPAVSRVLNLPLVGTLADRAYPWVARNRHRFPRRLTAFVFETGIRRAAEQAARRAHCGTDACRLPAQH